MNSNSNVKFDAAFIERRMAEHKRWQHDVTNELVKEAMKGMAEALLNPGFSRYAHRFQANQLPFEADDLAVKVAHKFG